jgi:hypothetical protein
MLKHQYDLLKQHLHITTAFLNERFVQKLTLQLFYCWNCNYYWGFAGIALLLVLQLQLLLVQLWLELQLLLLLHYCWHCNYCYYYNHVTAAIAGTATIQLFSCNNSVVLRDYTVEKGALM